MRIGIALGAVAIAAALGAFMFFTAAKRAPESVAPAAASAALVFSFDGDVDTQGVPAPWRLQCSTGAAQLSVQPGPDTRQQKVLWVKADKASFFLARTDVEFDPAEYPILEWFWKAVSLPVGGDVRKSSLNPFAENRNDQALQLLVTFDNRDVISYLWDTTASAGTEVKEANPFANIMSVVVESGAGQVGQWRAYRRNVADDYRRLHGGKARLVKAIAVQTNANHTRTQGEGFFGPITFKKQVVSRRR